MLLGNDKKRQKFYSKSKTFMITPDSAVPRPMETALNVKKGRPAAPKCKSNPIDDPRGKAFCGHPGLSGNRDGLCPACFGAFSKTTYWQAIQVYRARLSQFHYYQNHERRKAAARVASSVAHHEVYYVDPANSTATHVRPAPNPADMDPTVAAFLSGTAPLPMDFAPLFHGDPRIRGLSLEQRKRLYEAVDRVTDIRDGTVPLTALSDLEDRQLQAYRQAVLAAARLASDPSPQPPSSIDAALMAQQAARAPAPRGMKPCLTPQRVASYSTPAPQEDDFK